MRERHKWLGAFRPHSIRRSPLTNHRAKQTSQSKSDEEWKRCDRGTTTKNLLIILINNCLETFFFFLLVSLLLLRLFFLPPGIIIISAVLALPIQLPPPNLDQFYVDFFFRLPSNFFFLKKFCLFNIWCYKIFSSLSRGFCVCALACSFFLCYFTFFFRGASSPSSLCSSDYKKQESFARAERAESNGARHRMPQLETVRLWDACAFLFICINKIF